MSGTTATNPSASSISTQADEQGATRWDLASFRTKCIDPDYRRDPKTNHFCCCCQKDLKPGQKFRVVHLVDGGPYALHPADEARYQAVTDANGQHPGELGCHPIGLGCARKIGIEWSHSS